MKWIEKDTKVVGYGRDIIYAKDKYYMVSYNPAKICVSEDLENWIEYNLDEDKIKPKNIAYGNGIFVVTGDTIHPRDYLPTYFCYSYDGINWNYKSLDTNLRTPYSINFLKFINNRFLFGFCVTGYYSSNQKRFSRFNIFETIDCINVKKITYDASEANQFIEDITYANGMYIAAASEKGTGNTKGILYKSTNLSSWEKINSNTYDFLHSVVYAKGNFVAVGNNGTLLTSKDGINWTKQNSGTNSYLVKSRYANGTYMAVGYNGTVLSSVNGIDWTREDCPGNGVRYGLVFANDKIVITGAYYTNSNTIPIFYTEIDRTVSYSNDNSLYVFDKELNFLGVIDDFISLRWHRKLYEAGESDLVVAPLKNNLRLLQIDNIIIRQNYTEAMIIDTRELTDDGDNVEIKVSGKFLSYLLHRRIIKNKLNYSGNYIDGYKYLLQNMTPLCENFEIEPTSLDSENVVYQCTYKNVYEYHVKMSKNSNIGFRIVPNIETKTYIYENFKGVDRTKNQSKNERYRFSKEDYTLQKPELLETNIDKCNYVLVGGEGEDSNRIKTELIDSNISGLDLFEKFVDAKNERKDKLSDEEYINLLKEKGKEVKKNITKTVEFTGLPNDYKTKWDLGDIVDIEIDEFHFDESQRIIEVEESITDGEVKIYPVFGDPLEDKIELNSE